MKKIVYKTNNQSLQLPGNVTAVGIAITIATGLSILATYLVMSSNQSKQPSVNKETTIQPVKQIDKVKYRDDEIDDFIREVSYYNKTGTSLKTSCYKENSLPQDEQLIQIKNTLLQENRIIYSACINKQNNIILIVSAEKKYERYSEPYNITVDIYTFYEQDSYTSDFLFEEKSEDTKRYFKLVDWLNNGDIIYTLFNQYPYFSKTYLYNVYEKESNPRLIEYCELRVAKGTSAREFVNCIRFEESKNSIYLKQQDLP